MQQISTTNNRTQPSFAALQREAKDYLKILNGAIQHGYYPNNSFYQRTEKLYTQISTRSGTEDHATRMTLLDDADQMKRLAHLLQNKEYFKPRMETNKPMVIEILPAALQLPPAEFWELLKPLLLYKALFSINGHSYTGAALYCFEKYDLKELTTMVTCTLKGGKQIQLSQAECHHLTDKVITQADFSDVNEKTFKFICDVINNLEHGNDSNWFYFHPGVPLIELVRFRRFVEKHNSNFSQFYAYGNTAYIVYLKNIELDASCLNLPKDQFTEEMQELLSSLKQMQKKHVDEHREFLLKFNPNTPIVEPPLATIIIKRPQPLRPLTFSLEQFEKLYPQGPEVFKKTYPVEIEGNQTIQLDAGFYFEFITYQNEKTGKWEKEENAQLPCTDKTLKRAISWFETGQYPVMTWDEENQLLDLLDFCAQGSSWHVQTHERFANRIPFLTAHDLKNQTWNTLVDFLKPYQDLQKKYVQCGEEVYTIDFVLNLVKQSPSYSPSELARTFYFQLPNGSLVQGNLGIFSICSFSTTELPLGGDQNNPLPLSWSNGGISIYDPELLTKLSFTQLDQLYRIFSSIEGLKKYAEETITPLLQKFTSIKLGDITKQPKEYWSEVQTELKKYPQAKEIQLAGSSQSWSRTSVDAFISNGTITIQDLNTAVEITLYDSKENYKDLTYETSVRKVWLAEWKCFSTQPSQTDFSQKSQNPISAWEFDGLWKATFNGEKYEHDHNTRLPSFLSSYARKCIVPPPSKRSSEILPKQTISNTHNPLNNLSHQSTRHKHVNNSSTTPPSKPWGWKETAFVAAWIGGLVLAHYAGVTTWTEDHQRQFVGLFSMACFTPYYATEPEGEKFISDTLDFIKTVWNRAGTRQRLAFVATTVTGVTGLGFYVWQRSK